MADSLTLTLVTPTERLIETRCGEVRLPGTKGYFGVRAGHEALLTTLDAGPLHFFVEGKEDAFAILGGFAEIIDDHVLVLADEAVHVETIDVEHERAALEEARRKLCEVQADLLERKSADARVRRHAARVATVELV